MLYTLKNKILKFCILIITFLCMSSIKVEAANLPDAGNIAGQIADIVGVNEGHGGNSTVVDGISDSRTGFLVYLLDENGNVVSDTLAFKSPGYSELPGKAWIATSRKGVSVSGWEDVPAPWGCGPFTGKSSNYAKIKSWMMANETGTVNSVKFVSDYFSKDLAEKFKEGKLLLTLETLLHFKFSYPGNKASEPPSASSIDVVKYMRTLYNLPDTWSPSSEYVSKIYKVLDKLFKKQWEANGGGGSGFIPIEPPVIGTVSDLVHFYNSAVAPNPHWFRAYTHGVACWSMMIEPGGIGERYGKFKAYTGSTSSNLSDSDVLTYAVGTACFKAVDEMMQTTYDEKLGDTPGEPARESENNKYKIIKNYRLKTGETYEDKGVFMIEEVAPKILIEDEPYYKVVGWKISDQTKKPDSTIWETDVPGKISEEGKTPTSVLIKDPSTTLYVLLEKVEKEEIVEDANYVISESSVTRRVHISKPDNALDNIPEIGNLMFKWKLPGHLQSCNHSYSSPCEGHGHEEDCLDDCTSSHNCGSNCVTKYDSCSNYNFKDKSLKLSISNSYKDDYPHIVATKEGWRNEVNTGGRVKRFDTVERTNPNEEIYESSNWDLMIVLMRGNDKLTVAEWKNNSETNTDLVDASESGFHVNDKVQGVRKEATYFEKFNVYFTTEMENSDNKTIYGAFTKSPITNNLCWNERSAMLAPMRINDIKVKVETYSGDKNKGTTDTSHNDAKKLVFSNSNFNTSSGRMVKESGTITFNPYIEMKYDSDVKTNSQVYVLGQYQRSIMPNSYAEINWNYKNTENLKLTSSQWNTHASGMKWLNDNNIKDKNSILPGGAKHELTITNDSRQKVEVASYQVVVKGDFKEQVDRTGGNDGGFTEEKALNSHKDYVNSVINALDNLTVQQFINKDYEKNPFDGKPVYNESDISFLNNGTDCHASNYSSHLRQLYRKINPASPSYHLSQRTVFTARFYLPY